MNAGYEKGDAMAPFLLVPVAQNAGRSASIRMRWKRGNGIKGSLDLHLRRKPSRRAMLTSATA